MTKDMRGGIRRCDLIQSSDVFAASGRMTGNIHGSRRRGACHRAALCADPMAAPRHEADILSAKPDNHISEINPQPDMRGHAKIDANDPKRTSSAGGYSAST